MENNVVYRIYFEGNEIRLHLTKNQKEKIMNKEYSEMWLNIISEYPIKNLKENEFVLEIDYGNAKIIIEDYLRFLKMYSDGTFCQKVKNYAQEKNITLISNNNCKLVRKNSYSNYAIVTASLLSLTIMLSSFSLAYKKRKTLENNNSNGIVATVDDDIQTTTLTSIPETALEEETTLKETTSSTVKESTTETTTETTTKETTTQKPTATEKETTTEKKKKLINQYTTEYIKNRLSYSGGVAYYNGHRETYYEQEVLPGPGLKIPGRHVSEDGTIRDEDGYICVAADYNYLPYGSLVMTTLGMGKVYDTGCSYGTVDVYVSRAPFRSHHP